MYSRYGKGTVDTVKVQWIRYRYSGYGTGTVDTVQVQWIRHCLGGAGQGTSVSPTRSSKTLELITSDLSLTSLSSQHAGRQAADST